MRDLSTSQIAIWSNSILSDAVTTQIDFEMMEKLNLCLLFLLELIGMIKNQIFNKLSDDIFFNFPSLVVRAVPIWKKNFRNWDKKSETTIMNTKITNSGKKIRLNQNPAEPNGKKG